MEIKPDRILDELRSESAPAELKRSAARGLMPLGPAEMLEAFIILSRDRDEGIAGDAVKSLKKVPASLVEGVCTSPRTEPALLDRLARLFSKNEGLMEKIVLNPVIMDDTMAYLASLPQPAILEIIGRNQARLERAPLIMEALRVNSATPPDILRLWEERRARREERARRQEEIRRTLEEAEAIRVEDLPPLLVAEEEKPKAPVPKKESSAIQEEEKLSIIQMLREMSAGQRVALAMKGNSEVRKILIRDKNRLICTKVLENPRITDSEIEFYAKSTNLAEDVLRIIAATREWARQPSVRRALINNPKTPVALSMGFLKSATIRELESLSRNRNVPEALRNNARKMYKKKKEFRR